MEEQSSFIEAAGRHLRLPLPGQQIKRGAKAMGKVRILVVEDEGIIVRDIENRLNNLGYTVCGTAFSAGEAIRIAAEAHPDLVMMDIVLRGDMDGTEAAEQIRAHFNIPVVYLTAYADDRTLQRAKVTES
ncbi:response regulator, partial [Candidatus Omnitrophota bacterium]